MHVLQLSTGLNPAGWPLTKCCLMLIAPLTSILVPPIAKLGVLQASKHGVGGRGEEYISHGVDLQGSLSAAGRGGWSRTNRHQP